MKRYGSKRTEKAKKLHIEARTKSAKQTRKKSKSKRDHLAEVYLTRINQLKMSFPVANLKIATALVTPSISEKDFFTRYGRSKFVLKKQLDKDSNYGEKK